MNEVWRPPSPELVAELKEMSERRLTPEEFDAYVNAPFSDFEREEMDALIDWSLRRYPTAEARLKYARQAARRWKQAMPRGE